MCDIIGFLLYFLILILNFISIFNKNWLMLSLSMFFAILISSNRGIAGVDTYMYIDRYHSIKPFSEIPLVEPLIPLIMSLSKEIGDNFITFSFLYGIIISVVYMWIFKKNKGAIYFGLAMFPVLYVDSLFNGIRIGLAYPFIFLSIVYSSKIFYIFAIFSHISSLIAIFFRLISKKYLFLIIIILIVAFLYSNLTLYDLLSERYESKYNRYQEMYTHNYYSGVADSSLLFISLYIYFRSIGVRGYNLLKYLLLIFVIVILFHVFLVSKYIFMLRIVRLIDIIIFALIARDIKKIDKVSLYIAFVFGILYMINFLRQINASCNYGIGGFLPLNLGF